MAARATTKSLYFMFFMDLSAISVVFCAIYVEKERFSLKNISKLFFIYMARHVQKTKRTPLFLLSLSFCLFIFRLVLFSINYLSNVK